MTFKRNNKSDPFRNITLSAKELLDSDTATSPVSSTPSKSKSRSGYMDLGGSAKPSRPFGIFMIFTIMSILLAIHAILGLFSVFYVFIDFISSKPKSSGDDSTKTEHIVAFSLNTVFHLFRALIYALSIPLGCIAKPGLFTLAAILSAICLLADLLVVALYVVDKILSIDVAHYFSIELTAQQYISYMVLDCIFIVIVVFFVLELSRYRKANKAYKRSVTI